MTLRSLVACALCVAVQPLHGQDAGTPAAPLATDRPSESAGPSVVPRRALQFELGYESSRSDSGANELDTRELPELLVRFGVLDTVEARFTMNGWSFQETVGGLDAGFNDLSLGAKWALAEGGGLRPQAALLAEITIPVGDPGFTGDFWSPKVLMLFTNALSERVSLTYNLGASVMHLEDGSAGDRTVVDLPYTAMVSGSLGRQWGWFGELFGSFALDDRPDDHTFQGGMTKLMTDSVQLDVRAGVGLVDDVPDWLVGVGVGFRLLR